MGTGNAYLQNISDPASFFREMGALHGAHLLGLVYDCTEGEAIIRVDDLFVASASHPNYQGAIACDITLSNVSALQIEQRLDQASVRIQAVRASRTTTGLQVSVELLAGGSILAECANVSITRAGVAGTLSRSGALPH